MAAYAPAGREDIGAAIRTRLAGFIRTLRDNGFRIGLAETGDALRVLAAPGLERPSAVKPALRALLCGRRTDWDAFDALFDAFWRGRAVKIADRPRRRCRRGKALARGAHDKRRQQFERRQRRDAG